MGPTATIISLTSLNKYLYDVSSSLSITLEEDETELYQRDSLGPSCSTFIVFAMAVSMLEGIMLNKSLSTGLVTMLSFFKLSISFLPTLA